MDARVLSLVRQFYRALECGRLTRPNRDLYILICTKESPCLFVTAPESRQADCQGTSSVLYGDELKPELRGLSAEPTSRAFQSFFVAAVKDTLDVGLSGAEQVIHNECEFVGNYEPLGDHDQP